MSNPSTSSGNIRSRLVALITRRGSWSIIAVYNLITVLIIAAFYPVIPTLLNYPPNNEEVSTKLGTSNFGQYVAITLITVVLGTLILLWFFRGIDKWRAHSPENEAGKGAIARIRKQCIDLPNFIFMHQILIMMVPLAILLFTVATLNRITYLAPAKIVLMVTSFFSLAAVITHTFAKKVFKKVLEGTYHGQEHEGMRLSLRRKIFLQVVPIAVIAILYTSLIGYSRLIDEKGDLIYTTTLARLQESVQGSPEITAAENAYKLMASVPMEGIRSYFVVQDPVGELHTSDGTYLGGYLTHFMKEPYEGNRLYDINAEIQGAVVPVETPQGLWKLGVVYYVASPKAVTFFAVGFILILALNGFVLSYFSGSLSRDISQVADRLDEIAQGESVDLNKKIPVTSNDEIGDLIIAFNRILDREKASLQELEEQHEVMMEQERMASLGHLMGGIAHNMRTPIMSLAGAAEGLKDLVDEYENSIGDPDVTPEDHKEIAAEMRQWTERMKSHCSYMSDIITAIRGQTLMSSSDQLSFTLEEMAARIEVLLSHELRKHLCTLEVHYEIPKETLVNGELSVLVQVVNNLLLNAMDAYEGRGGTIEMIIGEKGQRIQITVQDHGPGIPEAVQQKLFKEMVTTKGKNGTGLGLYMSYSSLKGYFGGKMWYETGAEGTRFHIALPNRGGAVVERTV